MDTKNLASKIVLANLNVIAEEVLPLIEKDYARVAAQVGLDRLKQTIVILFDENPDDKDQMNAIWGNLAQDPQLVESVTVALQEAVASVKEPVFQAGLTLFINPVIQTLSAVTDGKPDGDQIKQIWLTFVKSPEVLDFLLVNAATLIDLIIKNGTFKKILLSVLNLFGKN